MTDQNPFSKFTQNDAPSGENPFAKYTADTPGSSKVDGSTLLDMAKGAGSGLAQGTLELATGPLDLGIMGGSYIANKGLKALGMPEGEPPPNITDKISKFAGIDYHPQTIPGDYAQTISSFLPAFASMSEGEIASVKKAVKALKGAAVTGGASETAGQATKGTAAEPYARILAALAPGGISAGSEAAARKLLRGGTTPSEIQSNTSAFEASGSTPTIGQATQGYVHRAIESFLSKMPGSAGRMRDFAYNQGQDIGKQVDDLANKLSPASSGEAAGRSIAKGITEDFIPKARAEQNKLYDQLDQYIKPDSMVEATNTEKVLADITKDIPGAENLSQTKLLSNSTLNEVQGAMKKDLGGTAAQPAGSSLILQDNVIPFSKPGASAIPARETLPYKALKELRTRVGQKIETVDMAPDVPKAQLKRLYGALSEDMKAAAYKAGPKAKEAFDKANKYTQDLHEKIDQMQSVIDKQEPEKVFRAAMSGTSEGATTLKTIMKSLPEESRKTFSAAVLRRMGRASAGNQNDIGNVFSSSAFLTNWNKLSPQAKSIMFDGYGAKFSYNMDKIAKVADNIKTGSKVFQNPSGTGSAEALIDTGKSLGASILAFLMGSYSGLGVALGGMAGANVAARMFTDPKMVEWLAKTTTMPASAAPAAVASLNNIIKGNEAGDEPQQDNIPHITVHRKVSSIERALDSPDDQQN